MKLITSLDENNVIETQILKTLILIKLKMISAQS